jgi:hypothetical protein
MSAHIQLVCSCARMRALLACRAGLAPVRACMPRCVPVHAHIARLYVRACDCALARACSSAPAHLRVDEDVLRLEVAVHDAAPVQLRERQRDLARVEPVRPGVEGRVVLQQVQELAAGEVVHDEIQPPLRDRASKRIISTK